MAPSLHTAAAGQPADLPQVAEPGRAPQRALQRCTRGCTGGRVAVVRLCDGTGRCAAPAELADDERANLPQPLVLEYPLLDWSAAMLGDAAHLAACQADAAGVPMRWLPEGRA